MVIFSECGIKVAVVVSPGLVEPRRLSELVAQNRGVDVRIFLALAAVEKWLKGELEPSLSTGCWSGDPDLMQSCDLGGD